MKKHRDWSLPL